MPTTTRTPNWSAIEAETWHGSPAWRSGTRLVSSNNLFLIVKGSVQYHDVSSAYTISAGSLLFVPRGVRHSLLAGPRGFTLTVLRLRLSAFGLHIEADAQAWEILMALTRRTHTSGPVLSLPRSQLAHLRLHVSSIIQAQDRPTPARLCQIKAAALNIIATLAAAIPIDSTSAARPAASFARMRAVIEYIEMHYPEHITIARLAGLAQLNRSRFHTIFKNHTGLSPVDYVTRVRIGEACRQLRDTTEPVLTIALNTGFASTSRFYEAFHQVVGHPPAQWRKRNPPA